MGLLIVLNILFILLALLIVFVNGDDVETLKGSIFILVAITLVDTLVIVYNYDLLKAANSAT